MNISIEAYRLSIGDIIGKLSDLGKDQPDNLDTDQVWSIRHRLASAKEALKFLTNELTPEDEFCSQCKRIHQ